MSLKCKSKRTGRLILTQTCLSSSKLELIGADPARCLSLWWLLSRKSTRAKFSLSTWMLTSSPTLLRCSRSSISQRFSWFIRETLLTNSEEYLRTHQKSMTSSRKLKDLPMARMKEKNRLRLKRKRIRLHRSQDSLWRNWMKERDQLCRTEHSWRSTTLASWWMGLSSTRLWREVHSSSKSVWEESSRAGTQASRSCRKARKQYLRALQNMLMDQMEFQESSLKMQLWYSKSKF